MSKRLAACSLAGLALLLETSSAHADVAPPPDYVESCTVERFERPGLECRSCSAWHGDVEACNDSLGREGFTHNCRTRGASAWTEVWCRPVRAEPPPLPPPTAPRNDDPNAVAAPRPAATLAVSPTGERGPIGTPETAADVEPTTGPTAPPPGARGCGGCAVAAPASAAPFLVGLALTAAAVGGGLGLRRTRRSRPRH